MGHAQPRLEHLPGKLRAIRRKFGVSQYRMARLLNLKGYEYRLSDFESGRRQPNVVVLLAYARIMRIPLEYIIDDSISLREFCATLTPLCRNGPENIVDDDVEIRQTSVS